MRPAIRCPRSIRACALVALCALFWSGCGGSRPAAPVSVLTYAPDPGSGASVTTAVGGGSTESIAVVEIRVADVLDVLTASFTLEFDPASVGFLDFGTAGSHLGSDGVPLEPVVQETQAGRLTVGLTRLSTVGIDFNGSRYLMRVRFSRIATGGTSPLTFRNANLLDAAAPPRSIPGIQWFGGTFRID